MFGFITDAVDSAVDLAGDVVGGVVDAADDYVFDTVDYVTGGVVDIDFDDGAFSVGVGFDGYASFGASIGEHGISAEGTLPGAELGLALTEDGVSIDGQAGIDYGPFPYVEGHLEVTDDGDVNVNGVVQGTIPTPAGLLSGSVEGGFAVTDDGWGASIDADGTLRMPSGTTITGGVEASYVETATGSHTSFAAEGTVSMPGMGSVGGGVAYERVEEGGDVVEVFHAEASAEGFGASAHAEADMVSTDIDGVETTEWSGSAQLDLPGDAFDLATDAVGDGGAATSAVAAVAGAAGAPDAGAVAVAGPVEAGIGDLGLDPVAVDGGFDDVAHQDLGYQDPGSQDPGFDDGFAEVAAPAEPVSDLDQAIGSADEVESSLDDLFEEI